MTIFAKISKTKMRKVIPSLLLLMLPASITLAAESPLNLNDIPDFTKTYRLPTQLKTALAMDTDTSDIAENRSNGGQRDCSSLTYEITLFKPCEGDDAAQLAARTKIMAFGGLTIAGFIALLPEEISKWDRSRIGQGQLLEQWWDHVRAGPVWDKDVWYINYIGHPYFGSVYYQSSRKSGYNQWNSFVYSFLMSTFYWEYGIEAFAEIPSMQDLVVTPVGGWIVGEWAYHKEKAIIANGRRAMGSKFLGSIALFFLDPVAQVGSWIGIKNVTVSSFNVTHQRPIQAWQSGVSDEDYWGINLSLQF